MVFSPNTLEGAPHRMLTTLEFPKGTAPEREGKVIQALSEPIPLVTAIKVGDIVEAAKELLGKVMTAISATAGVTLLIGAAVLAGAVAAGQERRKYLAVIFKTLGATRAPHSPRRAARIRPARHRHRALAVAIATLTAWALLQMGVRGGVRVLGAGRHRDGSACAWSSCWYRRLRHLAGAVGQGRALSPGRIARLTRTPPASSCAGRLTPPYSWPK